VNATGSGSWAEHLRLVDALALAFFVAMLVRLVMDGGRRREEPR